jgi:hypothetical protein
LPSLFWGACMLEHFTNTIRKTFISSFPEPASFDRYQGPRGLRGDYLEEGTSREPRKPQSADGMAALQSSVQDRGETSRGADLAYGKIVLFAIALTLITLLTMGTSRACSGESKARPTPAQSLVQSDAIYAVPRLPVAAAAVKGNAPYGDLLGHCPCGCGVCSCCAAIIPSIWNAPPRPIERLDVLPTKARLFARVSDSLFRPPG